MKSLVSSALLIANMAACKEASSMLISEANKPPIFGICRLSAYTLLEIYSKSALIVFRQTESDGANLDALEFRLSK